MQVHVVHAGNRRHYLNEIEAMHRHRHRIFVETMGWKALGSPDFLDVDEFDGAGATYLIALDAHGVVRGSGRLIPSWRPHMLKNLFPEYVEGNVPVGPGVWEWTRHAPGDADWPAEVNTAARLALHIAVHEFAITRGIESYTGIVETRMAPRMADLGWRVEPLGLPTRYGEGTAFGFRAYVDAANIEALRVRARRDDPVLFELPSGLAPSESGLARRSLELALQVPRESLGDAVRRLEDLVSQ
jgi:N-acyl-L-homoserine lactone synthetase